MPMWMLVVADPVVVNRRDRPLRRLHLCVPAAGGTGRSDPWPQPDPEHRDGTAGLLACLRPIDGRRGRARGAALRADLPPAARGARRRQGGGPGWIKDAATFSPYSPSKHAVLGLTKAAELEGAPFGIRVNCVAPGHIDTRMARDLTAQIDPADPDGVYRNVSATVPYGQRYGTASEVAAMVMWLPSSESDYVSGGIHLIDGALDAG